MPFEGVVVDTLNSIQSDEYMLEIKKPNFDKWRDYGTDIWKHIVWLQDEGFEVILIIGDPGTGKSCGLKGYGEEGPKKLIWFNCDGKNPTWEGGRKVWGTKSDPCKSHKLGGDYRAIQETIKKVKKSVGFEKNPIAFLLAHPETYETENSVKKVRLKTLGKVATKHNLEGRTENTFYSGVEVVGNEWKYFLSTRNSGFNTARSLENLFETDRIPNDFKFIIERIRNYE